MAGAVGTAAIVVGVAVLTAMATGGIGMVVGPLAAAAFLGWRALKMRHNPRMRPWAIGIWIGLGLGLLLVGTCWAFITGMEH